MTVKDVHGARWLDDLVQDVRYVAKLGRHPILRAASTGEDPPTTSLHNHAPRLLVTR
jgi:hypothetical protein